ncbi:MAG: hypothetical protein AAF320_01935 [Myxococcota bacterium]
MKKIQSVGFLLVALLYLSACSNAPEELGEDTQMQNSNLSPGKETEKEVGKGKKLGRAKNVGRGNRQNRSDALQQGSEAVGGKNGLKNPKTGHQKLLSQEEKKFLDDCKSALKRVKDNHVLEQLQNDSQKSLDSLKNETNTPWKEKKPWFESKKAKAKREQREDQAKARMLKGANEIHGQIAQLVLFVKGVEIKIQSQDIDSIIQDIKQMVRLYEDTSDKIKNTFDETGEKGYLTEDDYTEIMKKGNQASAQELRKFHETQNAKIGDSFRWSIYKIPSVFVDFRMHMNTYEGNN